jgi:hypothetical protein
MSQAPDFGEQSYRGAGKVEPQGDHHRRRLAHGRTVAREPTCWTGCDA